jgi:hypothetical protein
MVVDALLLCSKLDKIIREYIPQLYKDDEILKKITMQNFHGKLSIGETMFNLKQESLQMTLV